MNQELKKKVKDFPEKPGVYLMRGPQGEVAYVGKANSLRKRVSSYFAKPAESPFKAILLEEIQDIEIIPVRSESEALILEYRLIKEYRPKFNLRLKDDKRYPLVRLSLQEPLPKLSIVRVEKKDGARYFGRYTDASALRHTLEWMQTHFRLRTCTPRNPTQKHWIHCMDYKLGRCLAPCIGEISPEEYRARVNEVALFLEGKSKELVEELTLRMKTASANEEFEKAAEIRDTLLSLEKVLSVRKTKISLSYKKTDLAQAELKELKTALKLVHLPRRIEAFDISNIAGEQAVGSMVYFEDGFPNKNHYRRFKIKTVQGINDFAMMREVVRRRYQKAPLPDLILIDGGKGHLSAALKALAECGIHKKIAIVGLAKKYEELFLPNQSRSVILPRHSKALKLMQRIRDEAHRFAIGYHKSLRQKRITESILDDIEGVGNKRKKVLLNHFGSIAKIRQASLQEIAEVGQLGHALAKVIKETLK